MFLPLGFGGVLRRFPFAISLITIACLVWSFFFFPTIKRVSTETNKIFSALEKSSNLKSLLLEICPKRKIDPELCLKFIEKSQSKSAHLEKTDQKKDLNVALKAVIDQSSNFLTLASDLNLPVDEWPKDLKACAGFTLYASEIKKALADSAAVENKEGFLSAKSKTLLRFVRASFVHFDLYHLFGNLLLLVLIGIWVEQRIGSLATAFTFLIGSFCGFYLQMSLHPATSVLGASAGIMALMGCFFALFFHTQFRFLFFSPPVFRVVTLPSLVVFPLFYIAGDFVAVGTNASSGIAHAAHVGGVLFGFIIGLVYRKLDSLPKEQLFIEEGPFYKKLLQSNSQLELWGAFEEILKWNPQNWVAAQVFLKKLALGTIKISSLAQRDSLNKKFQFFASFNCKTNSQASEFLSLIPLDCDLCLILSNLTSSRSLALADTLANAGEFELARRLYSVALTKKLTPKQRSVVTQALDKINNYINEQNKMAA